MVGRLWAPYNVSGGELGATRSKGRGDRRWCWRGSGVTTAEEGDDLLLGLLRYWESWASLVGGSPPEHHLKEKGPPCKFLLDKTTEKREKATEKKKEDKLKQKCFSA